MSDYRRSAPTGFPLLWFDANVVVHGSTDSLLTAEITFGGLHGYVSKQDLNLVQFSSGRVGTASRMSSSNAACGISGAIPNPGLCRIDLGDVVLALSSQLIAIKGFDIV